MAIYLQSTTDENLSICIRNNLWGATSNKLYRWQPGDRVAVYVKGKLAALFKVTGTTYVDHTPLWPDRIYPHRISMRLEKAIHPSHRIPLAIPEIREVLQREHLNYGTTVVLNAAPLTNAAEKVIIDFIAAAPEWLELSMEHVPDLPDEEILIHKTSDYENEQELQAEDIVPELSSESLIEANDVSPHTEMQYYLAQLGQSLHYQIWIPKADQGRCFNGVQLAELSESELPQLPFNTEVMRIIRNIDVIWLQDNHPTHLFEVEHTTSVYSGLLRMSDLVALIPSLNIRMFICADADRKTKVRAEVNRPTFAKRSVPLAERCRFIPFDRLIQFMRDQETYLSYFSTEILDKISEELAN